MRERLAFVLIAVLCAAGCDNELESDSATVSSGCFREKKNPQKLAAGAAAAEAFHGACDGWSAMMRTPAPRIVVRPVFV